jgi:hypothetical protein
MEPWGRERHGWANREVEWSIWESDIEGKTAREAASEWGNERVSNGREHMSQCGQRASFNRDRPLVWGAHAARVLVSAARRNGLWSF